MGDRSITISIEPLGTLLHSDQEYTRTLKIDVSYDLGGANWFTGKSEPRGYYLGVSVATERDSGIFRSRLFGIGSGEAVKTLVQPADRFSRATMAKIVPDLELVARMTQHVLTRLRENDQKEKRRVTLAGKAVAA